MYMGMTECGHYLGKVGEQDHRCCGGRITKHAIIKCYKRGTIEAVGNCVNHCSYCTIPKRGMNMQPVETNNQTNVQTLIERAVAPVSEETEVAPMSQAESQIQPQPKPQPQFISQPSQPIESVIPKVVPTVVPNSLLKGKVSRSRYGTKSRSKSQSKKDRPKTIWQLWAEELEEEKNKPPVSPEVPTE